MVMNTPGGNTVSTAQLAVSLLASLARNLPAADMSVKEVM
jgi:phosphoglycerate dehydrogenase-like enzyme